MFGFFLFNTALLNGCGWFKKKIKTNTVAPQDHVVIAPVALRRASVAFRRVKPLYGELAFIDKLQESALVDSHYKYDDISETHEREYNEIVARALAGALIETKQLVTKKYRTDQELYCVHGSQRNNKHKESVFLVDKIRGTLYSPVRVEASKDLYDLDRFNSLLAQGVENLRKTTPSVTQLSGLVVGGSPRILDCGHSFCSGCLNSHSTAGLKTSNACPECLTVFTVAPKPVTGLDITGKGCAICLE